MSARLQDTATALVGLLILLVDVPVALAEDAAAPADWSAVGEALGRPGELQPDGSYRLNVPRTDIPILGARGIAIPPAMGLVTYAAFAGTPAEATVVGDTCMVGPEIDFVIDALRKGGIEVVALHNHLIQASPGTFFLHFQGHGPAVALARTVREAFDHLGKHGPGDAPGKLPNAGPPQVDWKAVAEILGRPAPAVKDGVFKVTLPRKSLEVALDGQKLPPGVGLACWAAFYACPCGKTMAMGDTCVSRKELQPALDALRKGGVHITAIHNHLLGEESRAMFMHFEVEGDALEIARTVRAAWDTLAQPQETDAPAGRTPIGFDKDPAEKPPAGFCTAVTGGTAPAVWVVRADPTAPSGPNVLAQTSTDTTDGRYPLVIHDTTLAKDASVSVRFKPVSGTIDQAAGIVVRYRDASNYYVTRANALEGNVRLYRVVDGRRKQFAGVDVPVASGQWHSLRLHVQGSHFKVFFNDKLLFEADDKTFSEPGRVGLWTKADSVTYFDDLTVEELKP